MKLTLLIIFSVFLSCQGLNSQTYEYVPFPTGNAIWSEFYRSGEHGGPPYFDTAYDKVAIVNEDTLINNILYKKLYCFNDTSFNISNAIYLGGLRECNKIVYYNGNGLHSRKPFGALNEEKILYDFNISYVGEVVSTDNYSINTNFAVYSDGWVVDDIDTIFLGNKLRRRISFYIDYDTLQWIEGIGGTQGLLFASIYTLISSPPEGDLICFSQNDTIVYFNNNYSECMPLSVPETVTEEKRTIQIFPNPATNLVYLNCTENADVEIINLQGQVVATKTLSGKNETVDVSGLSQGVYVVKVRTEQGVVTKKIVKE